MPEDLRGDAMHREAEEPDFESEEVVEERLVPAEPPPTPKAFATPRSEHLQPLAENGNGNGHKNGGGTAVGVDARTRRSVRPG